MSKEPYFPLAVGCGPLAFLCDAAGNGTVVSSAASFLSLRWRESDRSRSVTLTDAGIRIRCGAAAREGASLSSTVLLEVYPDRRSHALRSLVRAMHDETLLLLPSEGASVEIFDRYASPETMLCCLKVRAADSEEALYFFADGDCLFDREEKTLRFRPGYARWALFLSDDEDRAVDRRLHSLFGGAILSDPVYDPTFRREAKLLRARLSRIAPSDGDVSPETAAYRRFLWETSDEDGSLLTADRVISLREWCDRLRFYVADGDAAGSDSTVSFFTRLFERYGELPCACRGDGGCPTFVSHTVDPVTFDVMESLFLYVVTFGRTPTEAVSSLAAYALRHWEKYLKGDTLPFSGFEKNAADYRFDRRFYGSGENTERYLSVAEKALFLVGNQLPLAERRRAVSALDFARRRHAALTLSGETYPERLSQIRRPHRVTGLCDRCSTLTLLTRTEEGYFCPSCRSARERTLSPSDTSF